jgi:hypothetical protein
MCLIDGRLHAAAKDTMQQLAHDVRERPQTIVCATASTSGFEAGPGGPPGASRLSRRLRRGVVLSEACRALSAAMATTTKRPRGRVDPMGGRDPGSVTPPYRAPAPLEPHLKSYVEPCVDYWSGSVQRRVGFTLHPFAPLQAGPARGGEHCCFGVRSPTDRNDHGLSWLTAVNGRPCCRKN